MGNPKDLSGTWPLRRYLAGFLAPAVIAVVLQPGRTFFPYNSASPYCLAVFGAWEGGLRPVLLSAVISFLLGYSFLIEPYFFLWLPKQVGLVRLLRFAVIGPSITALGELQLRTGDALPATSANPRSGGMELCKI